MADEPWPMFKRTYEVRHVLYSAPAGKVVEMRSADGGSTSLKPITLEELIQLVGTLRPASLEKLADALFPEEHDPRQALQKIAEVVEPGRLLTAKIQVATIQGILDDCRTKGATDELQAKATEHEDGSGGCDRAVEDSRRDVGRVGPAETKTESVQTATSQSAAEAERSECSPESLARFAAELEDLRLATHYPGTTLQVPKLRWIVDQARRTADLEADLAQLREAQRFLLLDEKRQAGAVYTEQQLREKLAGCVALYNLMLSRATAAESALADSKRETDAYRKAKQENDERFMIERDEARLRASAAEDNRSRLLKLCEHVRQFAWAIERHRMYGAQPPEGYVSIETWDKLLAAWLEVFEETRNMNLRKADTDAATHGSSVSEGTGGKDPGAADASPHDPSDAGSEAVSSTGQARHPADRGGKDLPAGAHGVSDSRGAGHPAGQPVPPGASNVEGVAVVLERVASVPAGGDRAEVDGRGEDPVQPSVTDAEFWKTIELAELGTYAFARGDLVGTVRSAIECRDQRIAVLEKAIADRDGFLQRMATDHQRVVAELEGKLKAAGQELDRRPVLTVTARGASECAELARIMQDSGFTPSEAKDG